MKLKKMIAPTFIFIFVLLYFLMILIPIQRDPFVNLPTKVILTVVMVVLTVIFIKVFIERINEIKEGKEDDLSKY
ncbi:MAG: hypothetical protein ACOWWH_03160 [Eubacteriaceae bacterium]